MTGQKRPLRSGFTTGACATAAAKAAVQALLSGRCPDRVVVDLPGGVRQGFSLVRCHAESDHALAAVIKDAGDDPDVTNGAEIGACCRWLSQSIGVRFKAGAGVGTVTKPGLPVAVGEPAINPVPRRMIQAAVEQALDEAGRPRQSGVEVEIFVTNGELLARHTLNARLGVVGGLSILGTTGIVRPLSVRAWTETVESSMRVARAAGLGDVLLSTGRTSEAAVQRLLGLPEESRVMMGDYLRYSLEAAGRHQFDHIHLAVMWGKMIKAALGVAQTHVRHGALVPEEVAQLLERVGLDQERATELGRANTARQILDCLRRDGRLDIVNRVMALARQQAQSWSGLPVTVYLVSAEQEVLIHGQD